MILDWKDVLDSTIIDLNPLHREICNYLLSLSGKRRPTATHAFRAWGLKKAAFTFEMESLMTALRTGLKRRGVRRLGDLEIGED